MIKQIPYLGLSTRSSDYECQDGEIAAAGNILTDERGLITASEPTILRTLESGAKPLYIHEPPSTDTKYYIYLSGTDLKYIPTVGGTSDTLASGVSSVEDITSVGNVLTVLQTSASGYRSTRNYIFNNGSYTNVPTGLKIGVSFYLEGQLEVKEVEDMIKTVVKPGGATVLEHTEESINSVLGGITSFYNEKVADNKFVAPFFVRYGLELFDGSICYASAPIMMIPNSQLAPTVYTQNDGEGTKDCHIAAAVSDLMFKVRGDSDWSSVSSLRTAGIVKSLVVAVSAPILRYDMNYKFRNEDWFYLRDRTSHPLNSYSYMSLVQGSSITNPQRFSLGYLIGQSSSSANMDYRLEVPTRPDADVAKDMELNSSVQFVISKIDIANISANTLTKITMDSGTLSSLATREVFDVSSVQYNTMLANTLYSYNSRLNMADIKETIFPGWNPADMLGFTDVQNDNTTTTSTSNQGVGTIYCGNTLTQIRDYSYSMNYRARINATINGKQEDIVIGFGNYKNYSPIVWIYVPYKASSITLWRAVYENGTSDIIVQKRTFSLSEHSVLSGSYYVDGSMYRDMETDKAWATLTSGDPEYTTIKNYYTRETPDTDSTKTVSTESRNTIIQSEVNNPFVFKPTGRITVGNDRIIRMAANTRAISEGQFGAYPLYAFTENGVYSLSLNDTGEYVSCQPATRDVVLGNGESICQTDNAILFAAQRGIMELQGNNARCISLQLDNPLQSQSADSADLIDSVFGTGTAGSLAPLSEYLDGCRIIYDYTSQRYIVFNPKMVNGSRVYGYAYSYSRITDTWGAFPCILQGTLNSYPEALATEGNKIMDVSTVTTSETSGDRNNGWFLTRPISLGSPNEFKVIDYVRQDGVLGPLFKVTGSTAIPDLPIPERLDYDPEFPKVNDYAQNVGGFVDNEIDQVLFGSNDLIHWHIICSSRSQRISDYGGTPYKWFRLAVRCCLKPHQSVSAVTFSYRIKSENNKLL